VIRPPRIPDLHKRTAGFDFLVGDWLVDNRRLRTPFEGKDDWYTTAATATAWTLHNGAISIDEMWFPELGFAGAAKTPNPIPNPTWEALGQNATEAKQWAAIGITDPAAANDFAARVRQAADAGMAVLMATHDLFNARQVADRIAIMRAGALVAEVDAHTIGHQELEDLYLHHARELA